MKLWDMNQEAGIRTFVPVCEKKNSLPYLSHALSLPEARYVEIAG